MMRVFGYIGAALVVLAALQLAIQVVVVGLLIVFVISLISRPAETLAGLLILMVYAFIIQHPIVSIPTLAAIGAIRAWQRRKSVAETCHLLPPPKNEGSDSGGGKG